MVIALAGLAEMMMALTLKVFYAAAIISLILASLSVYRRGKVLLLLAVGGFVFLHIWTQPWYFFESVYPEVTETNKEIHQDSDVAYWNRHYRLASIVYVAYLPSFSGLGIAAYLRIRKKKVEPVGSGQPM